MREDLEAQSKKEEEKACSFQPKLMTFKHSSKSRGGDSKNIFDALYDRAATSLEKKQQAQNSLAKPAFQPTISSKSSKLAEKKRKKRFYGVAAAHPPAPPASNARNSKIEAEECELDDGFHSAREGDEFSRRSSLDSNPTPRDGTPNTTPQRIPESEDFPTSHDVLHEAPAAVCTSAAIPELSSNPIPKPDRAVESKVSLFDALYEERKLFEKAREDSTARYSIKPSFQPDIGVAHHRPIEKTVEEFSQRLAPQR
jgi:hypothetical protein